MKQLAYISTAVRLMNDEQLFEILKVARKRNAEHNITGVLLYSEGTFIQALEGDDKAIYEIFDLIERDNRHKNIIKLVDKPLHERNFPDWSMGFAVVDQDRAKEIAGFLSSTDEIVSPDNNRTLVSILKTFIVTNNLVIAH